MELIISILGFIILYLILKNQSDKSRYKRQGREEITDREYPYILKGFSGVYDSHYSKYNYKTFDEAKSNALELTTNIGIDGRKVSCDKTEIWFEERLLKTFITNHRIHIENVDGFKKNLYSGHVFKNQQFNFDLSQISSYKSITVRLTNGEIHLIERPYFSLQENCLKASFITYLKEMDRDKTQDYRCIPINIIDKIISFKTFK